MEDVTLFAFVFVIVLTCNITSILMGQVSKTILAIFFGSCACLMRGGPIVRLLADYDINMHGALYLIKFCIGMIGILF